MACLVSLNHFLVATSVQFAMLLAITFKSISEKTFVRGLKMSNEKMLQICQKLNVKPECILVV